MFSRKRGRKNPRPIERKLFGKTIVDILSYRGGAVVTFDDGTQRAMSDKELKKLRGRGVG